MLHTGSTVYLERDCFGGLIDGGRVRRRDGAGIVSKERHEVGILVDIRLERIFIVALSIRRTATSRQSGRK